MNIVDYLKGLYNLFAYEDLFLISLAIIVGLLVGAEREYQSKTAGLRTLMLVSVGSCTFTILSIKIGVDNPDRLAANIITGIGFLGAGSIFRDENKVSGITTACAIWVTAALGMCIGSGHIYLGLLSTLVVLFVLMAVVRIERWIDRRNQVSLYKITIDYKAATVEAIEQLITTNSLRYYLVSTHKIETEFTVVYKVSGHQINHKKLANLLLNDNIIKRVDF